MAEEVKEELKFDKWFIQHPLSLYQENVKQLARDRKLKIVDIKFINEPIGFYEAKSTPELTLVTKPMFLDVDVEPQGVKQLTEQEIRQAKKEALEQKYGVDEPKGRGKQIAPLKTDEERLRDKGKMPKRGKRKTTKKSVKKTVKKVTKDK